MRKAMYSRYVILREVRGTPRIKEDEREKELGKKEFEMNVEILNLGESIECDDEVEQWNPYVRRYGQA